MKMRLWLGLFVTAFLALWTPVQVARAKGPADKITVQGPGLTGPVEITDPQALDEFTPWGDRFLDLTRGIIREPPAGQSYQVTIEVKPQWVYSFDYVLNPAGGPGYIYLPGAGDARYQRNIGTIIRAQDGRWLFASPEWDALMQRVLMPSSKSPTGDIPKLLPVSRLGTGSSVFWAIPLGAGLLILGSALYACAQAR
jgi:hypothetical protein